jgi:hypothetical protein
LTNFVESVRGVEGDISLEGPECARDVIRGLGIPNADETAVIIFI